MRRNHGGARLAQVISGEATRRATKPPTIELGLIEANLSLLLDSFPIPIPPADYELEESFVDATTRNRAGGAGEGSFDAHDHVIRKALAAGDRVIVLMLDNDSDGPTPIIIGRLA